MDKEFDVIIVGGGPAGLFAGYYIATNSNLKVLILERGEPPKKRICPMLKDNKCRGCEPCNILSGIGGAGLFSDGKLNFIPKLGKTDLTQFMDPKDAKSLIDETESIFNRFGMDGESYPTDIEKAKNIRKEARKEGIELLIIKQKHLGTDRLPEYIDEMMNYLISKGVNILTKIEVYDIIVKNDHVIGVITSKGRFFAKNVIVAPGRIGSEWLVSLAKKYRIGMFQRGIEVGVRVEVLNDIMEDITSVIYDPTFFIQTKKYDDQTRTFCTNRGGYVTIENYKKFVCVNGHAYMDRKSKNTNFALLSKVVLTEPVTDNHRYGESIGSLATLIGGGKPILQRFGDLKRGRRSTWNRIKKGFIVPTLKNVTCGDIAMAIPERILTNIVEALEMLNRVIAGVANDETLLYAPEIKFFSTQIETNNKLETKIKGLYVAGDGAGVAGNIVGAAASGLIPAKAIVEK